MDTIDASADDVSNLYRAVILYNLCMHFEKKFFGKEVEFLKEAHDLIAQSFLKDYFIGFVEPNKITSGICDIIISDG